MPDPQDKANVHEFIRFALVGLAQNGLNLAVFALTVSSGVNYIVAYLIAAVAALTASFALNLLWTFKRSAKATMGRVVRFVGIWVTMVLVGLPMLAILVGVAGLPRVAAQALVIVTVAPLSYLAQRRWTFARDAPQV